MERTKKEKALDDILELRNSWCVKKIVKSGCDGCPMLDGGSINQCVLNTVQNYIEIFFDDDLNYIVVHPLLKEVLK